MLHVERHLIYLVFCKSYSTLHNIIPVYNIVVFFGWYIAVQNILRGKVVRVFEEYKAHSIFLFYPILPLSTTSYHYFPFFICVLRPDFFKNDIICQFFIKTS
jgi:hypothetical protein